MHRARRCRAVARANWRRRVLGRARPAAAARHRLGARRDTPRRARRDRVVQQAMRPRYLLRGRQPYPPRQRLALPAVRRRSGQHERGLRGRRRGLGPHRPSTHRRGRWALRPQGIIHACRSFIYNRLVACARRRARLCAGVARHTPALPFLYGCGGALAHRRTRIGVGAGSSGGSCARWVYCARGRTGPCPARRRRVGREPDGPIHAILPPRSSLLKRVPTSAGPYRRQR